MSIKGVYLFMVKCARCNKLLKTDALFDEHFEEYFCDEQCLDEYINYRWEDFFTYYRQLNVVHVSL